MKNATIHHTPSFISRSLRKLCGFFRLAGYRVFRSLRKLFKHKKIVIISDKQIVSIPITTSMQVSFCLAVMMVSGWMLYSSGRYVAFREVLHEKEQAFQESLSEKEKEITVTNLTNKDLLSQVANLQRTLLRINGYFENTAHGPLAVEKKDEQKTGAKKAKDENALLDKVGQSPKPSEKEVALMQKAANKTLLNINQQIHSRIKNLEKAVAVTGLNLRQMADITPVDPKEEDLTAQGGPYFAARSHPSSAKEIAFALPKNLGRNIDYLLQLEEVVYNLPISHPNPHARITSGFGTRTDPFRHSSAVHYGLDLAGPLGAKIYSTAPGKVIKAGRSGAYGNMIEISHGNGITTRYGHLGKILVKPGMKIQRGQVIGLEGSTGRSTGAHLHYEVRYNNVPRNPENFIKAGAYVFSQRKS